MTMKKKFEKNPIWSSLREDQDIDDMIFGYDVCWDRKRTAIPATAEGISPTISTKNDNRGCGVLKNNTHSREFHYVNRFWQERLLLAVFLQGRPYSAIPLTDFQFQATI